MKSLPNIEKSFAHKGEYVGYAAEKVWRIIPSEGNKRKWAARPSPDDLKIPTVYGATLEEVSKKLLKLSDKRS